MTGRRQTWILVTIALYRREFNTIIKPYLGESLLDVFKSSAQALIWRYGSSHPHITGESGLYLQAAKSGADVMITEIGGTTGDIKPFWAIRQISRGGRENCLFIHVTGSLPKRSGEHKSAYPALGKGIAVRISPNIIIARADEPFSPA